VEYIHEQRMRNSRVIFKEGKLDTFTGKKKHKGINQTKRYHGMFDGIYFEDWMQKLLASLEARGIANTVIVLDSAKYH